jgi:drug/metabolite transporter (DMT)-like permease
MAGVPRSPHAGPLLGPEPAGATALVRTLALTSLAMCAFAANSLLCRAALAEHLIDAASFTTVRLICGALTLFVLTLWRAPGTPEAPRDWVATAMLFLYAAAFSFAYLSLSAATGALILFGAVQLTMLAAGLRAGERFPAAAWAGLAFAVGGVAYLLSPGVRAPPPFGAALMATAGVAWGVYSLRGRGSQNPLGATARNFVSTVPFTAMLMLIAIGSMHISPRGAWLAAASGALTSALGYVVWYAALKHLPATRAAVAQLSVPLLAAVGALLFLAEPITLRLAISSVAVLGGIAFVMVQRSGRIDEHVRG